MAFVLDIPLKSRYVDTLRGKHAHDTVQPRYVI